MDEAKRARLKSKGWVETTVTELFGLEEDDKQEVESPVSSARENRRQPKVADARLNDLDQGVAGTNGPRSPVPIGLEGHVP